MKYLCLTTILLVLAFTAGALISPNPATAASAAEIDRDAQKALGIYMPNPLQPKSWVKRPSHPRLSGIVKGGLHSGRTIWRGRSEVARQE